ncbi:MAG: type II toxin-antitoxin system HicB family antitoxin [Chloroflexi bacterium]|nr:type II toxin-antitoxin system HicB family antitoxin [Chloroflexota bacterium]
MIKQLMVQIVELPEGGYMATSEDLPDLIAYAQTVSEAIDIAKDVAQKLVDSYVEHGDALPWEARESESVHSEMIAVAVADG